ncbi:MAG TPA: peptide deformylase [Smithellaceae bacterium]|nr:peptide deformylase [Smithellaceae bacterium]
MKTSGATLDLQVYPAEVLRQICKPVEQFDAELRDMIEAMFALMRRSEGIGLAAPQAGLARQVFVCRIQNETLALVNPVIVETGKETQMVEGCLSLPGMHINVTRHDRIYVAALDVRGRRMQYDLTGLWARVVQHEMDHLNGVLICDYGEPVTDDALEPVSGNKNDL